MSVSFHILSKRNFTSHVPLHALYATLDLHGYKYGPTFKRKIHICLAGERTYPGLWKLVRITRGPLPPLQYPLQGKDIAPTVAPKPNAHPRGLGHKIEFKYIDKS